MRLFLLSLLTAIFCGCGNFVQAPFEPPGGFIYANHRAPLSLKFNHTDLTNNEVGVASTIYLKLPFTYGFGSLAWKDCSLATACRNGGIEKVEYADYEYWQVLGFFGIAKVRAHGKRKASPP